MEKRGSQNTFGFGTQVGLEREHGNGLKRPLERWRARQIDSESDA